MGNAQVVPGTSIPVPSCTPHRRYRDGLYVGEYWEEVAWPENHEMLKILNLNHDQAKSIFMAYAAVDIDNSGEMSIEEFHDYLGIPVTLFSERIFGVLDTDGSGALNFSEFCVGVWNYCTYDTKLIAKVRRSFCGTGASRPRSAAGLL